MRGKLVNEYQHFERGQEPKKSMNIGKEALDKQILDNTAWHYSTLKWESYYKLTVIDHGSDRDWPILLIEDPLEKRFLCTTTFIHTEWENKASTVIDEMYRKLDRAWRITESQNFERGQEPKKAMDIGKFKTDREKIASIEWSFMPIGEYDIEEFIEDYKGFPILIYSKWANKEKVYRATSTIDYAQRYSEKKALEEIKRIIDDWTSSEKTIIESNFERGIDPKKAMDIGKSKTNREKMESIETRGWTRKLKIDENSSFERGIDPKRAMGIDRISKLNKEIEWSWDVPKGFQEDIWDIVEHKGYYIKVSKLTWTAGGGTTCYIAVNDIGEPYVDVPINFPTPEQALDKEKNEIDHYVDEN